MTTEALGSGHIAEEPEVERASCRPLQTYRRPIQKYRRHHRTIDSHSRRAHQCTAFDSIEYARLNISIPTGASPKAWSMTRKASVPTRRRQEAT
jgi:hypothetical protein